MWTVTLPWEGMEFHLDARPLLEAICHSFCVWIIQLWFTCHAAAFAGLVIYSCIVSPVEIFPYSDGYSLACPDSQACCIAASELAHDIRIIFFYAAFGVVLLVEAEGKIVFVKEVRHFIVKWRIHRPFFVWLWFCGRLWFLRRHRKNGWMFRGLSVNSGILVVLCQSLVVFEMAIACYTVGFVCWWVSFVLLESFIIAKVSIAGYATRAHSVSIVVSTPQFSEFR